MIYIRALFSLSFMLFCLYLSIDYFQLLHQKHDYIVVDSIINIWAVVSGTFVGGLFFVYYMMMVFSSKIPSVYLNRLGLILIFIASPLITLYINVKITSLYSSYTECNDLRELSSRYSSRTYAISPELCEPLKT